MRKGVVKTNLIIILGSLVIAVAAIVFNYRINYQERLDHAKQMLVSMAHLDLTQWLKHGYLQKGAEASQSELEELLRQHLHLPDLNAFGAIIDRENSVRASIGLPKPISERLRAGLDGMNGSLLDVDHYTVMLLWPEGISYQLLVGFDQTSIDRRLRPMMLSTALFVGAAVMLYSVLVIATVRYTVINPLTRFLEKGIQANIEGIVSGSSTGRYAMEPPSIAPPELAEQFSVSMRMLDTWARHKCNLDKFITVSINENDKHHLIQNLFKTLKNEFPITSFTLFESNHSANRLVPLFSSAGNDFPHRLLSEPERCYVYRSGMTLVQNVGERYCQECKLDDSESLICRSLSAGGKQMGVCRIVVNQYHREEEQKGDNSIVERLGVLDAFLEPYIDLLALGLSNLLLLDSYKNQAVTDGLTGLYNRRYIVEYLTSLLNLAKRNEEPLSVFILDVDNFKRLNDEYGHTTGDQVLKVIAQTMRRSVRESDTVARYGGEEFVGVLPLSDSHMALEVAERVRTTIARIEWDRHGVQNVPQVTVSVGVAVFPLHGYSHYHLINASDQALYRAKRAGKNRVSLHRALPDEMEPADPETA